MQLSSNRGRTWVGGEHKKSWRKDRRMSVGVQGAFRLFHYDFKPRDQWILLIPAEFLSGQQYTGGCPTAIYGSQWWWHSACTYLVPGHVGWEHVWSPPEDKEYPTATFISSALASAETSGGGWCWRHYSGCVGKPVWLRMSFSAPLCCTALGDLEVRHALTFRKLKCSVQGCRWKNLLKTLWGIFLF